MRGSVVLCGEEVRWGCSGGRRFFLGGVIIGREDKLRFLLN